MERGVFLKKMQGGLKQQWPGVQIIMNGAAHRRQLGQLVRGHVQVRRLQCQDLICVKDLDAKFEQYQESFDPRERKKLAEEIQRAILENHYFVPVFRHAFVNAIGPRIAAQKWQDVFPTITTGYAYPWEDIKLKE